MEFINYKSEQFKYPIIEKEMGEFQRVSEHFKIPLSELLYVAEEGKMVLLDDELVSKLENTDYHEIQQGDWEKVARLSAEQDDPRDWKTLKDEIESGKSVSAPIILKFNDIYHLVSGNTRLMVCKAAGVTPKVLLVEVNQ